MEMYIIGERTVQPHDDHLAVPMSVACMWPSRTARTSGKRSDRCLATQVRPQAHAKQLRRPAKPYLEVRRHLGDGVVQPRRRVAGAAAPPAGLARPLPRLAVRLLGLTGSDPCSTAIGHLACPCEEVCRGRMPLCRMRRRDLAPAPGRPSSLRKEETLSLVQFKSQIGLEVASGHCLAEQIYVVHSSTIRLN